MFLGKLSDMNSVIITSIFKGRAINTRIEILRTFCKQWMDYGLYHPCPIVTPNKSSFIVVNPASKGIIAREGLILNAIAVDFVEVNYY